MGKVKNDARRYAGIWASEEVGPTPTGNIIRDAWVFQLLPEEQDCAGWSIKELERLYDQVTAAWEPYGYLVSRLPPELRERHARIYGDALRRARERGWNPELGLDSSD